MKKLTIIILLMLLASTADSIIVNNSTSTPSSEDSVSFLFYSLDSIGNPTTADSIFMLISGPEGSLVYRDSMAIGASRISSTTIRGKQFYSFKDQVSNIDGSGADGAYAVTILALKNSTGLLTPSLYAFQVVSEELSDQLAAINDSVLVKGGVIDSNKTELGPGPDSTSIARWVWNTSHANHTGTGTFGKFVDTTVSSAIGSGPDSTSIARWVWNTSQANHIGAGTFGKFVDTTVSSVSSSGLDSGSIAGWIWNTPQSNHAVAGTFGKYLDSEISGISAGSGAYSIVIAAYDVGLGQVIPNTLLAIRNLDQTSLLAVGITETNGSALFNLDADSFLVVATAAGYDFAGFDTIIVTGAGTHTITGSQFDPGTPSAASLCRVYGNLYDVSGAPSEGTVIMAGLPSGIAISGGRIVSPHNVETTTDSLGYFYLDLIPSDSLIPTGTNYEMTIIRSDGAIMRQRLAVPDQASWQLSW